MHMHMPRVRRTRCVRRDSRGAVGASPRGTPWRAYTSFAAPYSSPLISSGLMYDGVPHMVFTRSCGTDRSIGPSELSARCAKLGGPAPPPSLPLCLSML